MPTVTSTPSASDARPGGAPAAIDTVARLYARLADQPRGNYLRLIHDGRDDELLSYAELIRYAERFAASYRDAGLNPGARVVILCPHSRELYAAFLGALIARCVPAICAPPSPKVAPDDYARTLDALLANARPALVFTTPDIAERMNFDARVANNHQQTQSTQARVVRASRPYETTRCASADECPEARLLTPERLSPDRWTGPQQPADPNQTAFLQYSSGTTGLKKGVAISHRALAWQIDTYAAAIELDPRRDRIVSWLPLYHDMGLVACLLLPILTGTPLVAMCPFEWVRRPAMWLRAVSRHRGTLAWLPNFAYAFMARTIGEADLREIDLSSLRGLVNCSEPILHDSHRAFAERFARCGFNPAALCGSYAMAENTFAVTSGGFDRPLVLDRVDADALARDHHARPAGARVARTRILISSGRPLPQTEIRIIDDAGRALPERSIGQILLRSPCLLEEYYANPTATRDALHDGWYHTGDAGYLAGNELFVIGRLKDLLIIRGQNIYPQDIELLAGEVPGVIPGRVAAIGIPDPRDGTQALVVLAETHEAGASARQRLAGEIRTRIAAATDVTPADVCLLDHMTLRKSTSGKLSRSINRQRYLDGQLIGRPNQGMAGVSQGGAGVPPADSGPGISLIDKGGAGVPPADSGPGISPISKGGAGVPPADSGPGISPISKGRAGVSPADLGPGISPISKGGAGVSPADLGSTLAAVTACVARVLPCGAATPGPDDRLITTGLIDSLGLAELLAAVENTCGVRLPAEALTDTARIDTIAALADLVAQLAAPQHTQAQIAVGEGTPVENRCHSEATCDDPTGYDCDSILGNETRGARALGSCETDEPRVVRASRPCEIEGGRDARPTLAQGRPTLAQGRPTLAQGRPSLAQGRPAVVQAASPESGRNHRDALDPHAARKRPTRPAMNFWTLYYRWVFWRRGIRCGRGLRVLGRLLLRLDGDPRNISIGDDVTLLPGVDLKVRENGRIDLGDGVQLDTNVRLVAANDARIEIGPQASIGMGTIVNAGADVTIGRGCLLAGYCTISASDHHYLARTPIREQGYQHAPIHIGDDVWLAAGTVVTRGSRVGHGAVIGAHSVVSGTIPPYAVAVGQPARVIRYRPPNRPPHSDQSRRP